MTTSTRAMIPGSKSITNRAGFLAAAARGTSVLERPLVSDDTVAFTDGLAALGVGVERGDDAQWSIEGLGGGPVVSGARAWCSDAATAGRFLPALAAVGRCDVAFAASEQLERRPMRPMLDALRALGVATDPPTASALPFRLESRGVEGGEIAVEASQSSQFLSALLMAAPLTRTGLTVRTASSPVSAPYVDMTIRLMRRFGADVERPDERTFRVEPQRYAARHMAIEPDASSASYFFAAAAATGREVVVEGLGASSLQGDLAFVEVLREMGAAVRIEEERSCAGSGGCEACEWTWARSRTRS